MSAASVSLMLRHELRLGWRAASTKVPRQAARRLRHLSARADAPHCVAVSIRAAAPAGCAAHRLARRHERCTGLLPADDDIAGPHRRGEASLRARRHGPAARLAGAGAFDHHRACRLHRAEPARLQRSPDLAVRQCVRGPRLSEISRRLCCADLARAAGDEFWPRDGTGHVPSAGSTPDPAVGTNHCRDAHAWLYFRHPASEHPVG